MIDSQCRALLGLGHEVRLVVGEGGPTIDRDHAPGTNIAQVPELHPSHPGLLEARSQLRGQLPPPDHPLVLTLAERISNALRGCSQCWIHNALTVYLNPFLTIALLRLISRMPEIGWVAWCHDLSNISVYWPRLSEEEQMRVCAARPEVRYVTISLARRSEVSRLLSLNENEIRVIPPPLDVLDWLDLTPEVGEAARRLDLESAEPLILVPSKLLPHKNLGLAVYLAAALRSRAPRPLVLLTGAFSPHERQTSESVRQSLNRLIRELGVEDAVYLCSDVLGTVPDRRTVQKFMLLSDIVLLASIEEGFSVPMQEAAALRVPVLCSDIPAFREVGCGTARFFSPDDAIDLIAAKAAELADSPANRKRRQVLQSSRRYRLQLHQLVETVDARSRSGGPRPVSYFPPQRPV